MQIIEDQGYHQSVNTDNVQETYKRYKVGSVTRRKPIRKRKGTIGEDNFSNCSQLAKHRSYPAVITPHVVNDTIPPRLLDSTPHSKINETGHRHFGALPGGGETCCSGVCRSAQNTRKQRNARRLRDSQISFFVISGLSSVLSLITSDLSNGD